MNTTFNLIFIAKKGIRLSNFLISISIPIFFYKTKQMVLKTKLNLAVTIKDFLMNNLLKLLVYSTTILGLISCVATKNKNYIYNQKYSTKAFQKDAIVLKQVLETHHPSLYWHTSKDSMDKLFSDLLNYNSKDSLTEIECRNKLQQVVEQIKCGHTTVRFSKQFNQEATKFLYPIFPLQIKTWGDSLVVLGRYNVADSMLKRGTIITSINGKKTKEILKAMFKLVSTDANANNHKSQVITGNFPLWHKYCFGLDSIYSVGYIKENGMEDIVTIKWFKPIIDTSKKIKRPKEEITKTNQPSKKEKRIALLLSKRSLVIDSASNTAYIKLSSFTGGKLKVFFRKSFKTIHQQNIKNLVFDLRENSGGRVHNAILLNKYLSKLAFKVGDTIAAKSPTLTNGKYIGFHWAYTIAKIFGSKKLADGYWHNSVYETKYFAPKTTFHFDGKIYIIQGGYTFSAATLFAGWLRNQSNVTTVGEESGGAYYGNSAMFIPTIYLPNTKLRVSLPLYKLVMDNYRQKGSGIIPHIEIPPNSYAIKKGLDLKIERLKQIINADATVQKLP
jgi:C-terminal processing protease CtpA/Prc